MTDRRATPALALSLSIVTALIALAGCEREPESAPPSVLLITMESMRADQLGDSWRGRPVTPRLDELAARGVVYQHAVSPAPWTTPAVTSILTGHPAPAHGLEEHDRALAEEVEVVAERFRAAGYRTAAFVSAATLRPAFGLNRGFEIYDYENFGHERISSPSLTGKVQHRLQQWQDERFFIWVHLWDPHYNYRPQPPYDTRFERGDKPEREDVQRLKWTRNPVTEAEADYLYGQYQGEVAYTDHHVGKMLDTLEELGLRDELIIAVVGDHGEAFLEHGWLGHTNRLDEVNVHVPLVIQTPDLAEPASVSEPVSAAQLPRTLLEQADLPSSDFGSVPSLPNLRDGSGDQGRDAPDRLPLAQTRRRGCLTGIVEVGLKLVVDQCSCEMSLYDLREDPGEKQNLADASPDDVDRLARLMRRELERAEALDLPHAPLPEDAQREVMSALRALGYVEEEGGEKLAVCEVAEDARRRDTFGDLIARGPCPPAGALECLRAVSVD
jgi:arylsulfatase A-like enzyme